MLFWFCRLFFPELKFHSHVIHKRMCFLLATCSLYYFPYQSYNWQKVLVQAKKWSPHLFSHCTSPSALWCPEAAEDPEGAADEWFLSSSQQLPSSPATCSREGERVGSQSKSWIPPISEYEWWFHTTTPHYIHERLLLEFHSALLTWLWQ